MKLENISSLIAVSCVVSLLILLWKILNSILLEPKRLEKSLRAQGFNGNSYKPFYGDLKELGKMHKEAQSKPINFSDGILQRVVPFFHETIKRYGRNSFIWFGPEPLVFIRDPELVKEIFVKHNLFQKPPPNGLRKLLVQGIIFYHGEKWEKHRKLMNPAFHVEKIKQMLPVFNLSVSELLSKWEAIVSPKGSAELDVWPYVKHLTSDVISRAAFGSSYEEGIKIFELQREQAEHFMMVGRTPKIPGWRFLPTKRNRRMKYIHKEIEISIRDIINKRLKALKERVGNTNHLLGLLLESNEQEIKIHGDKYSGMTIEDIIEECKLFYFAGEETSSSLLVWTLILLAKHQEWQSRAREEVLQQFGRNVPDFERLNRLKTVTMILNETLRLYPPLVSVERRVHKDTEIGSFTLPAGVMVTLPIIFLHYDTKIWGDDAEEFKPDRFAEGVSKATKGTAAFFPFGWGPKICMGQNFAMVESKLAIARILQNFSFELSPSYSHAPQTTVMVYPQHGAHLVLHKL